MKLSKLRVVLRCEQVTTLATKSLEFSSVKLVVLGANQTTGYLKIHGITSGTRSSCVDNKNSLHKHRSRAAVAQSVWRLPAGCRPRGWSSSHSKVKNFHSSIASKSSLRPTPHPI
jgi:hypothetical protein